MCKQVCSLISVFHFISWVAEIWLYLTVFDFFNLGFSFLLISWVFGPCLCLPWSKAEISLFDTERKKLWTIDNLLQVCSWEARSWTLLDVIRLLHDSCGTKWMTYRLVKLIPIIMVFNSNFLDGDDHSLRIWWNPQLSWYQLSSQKNDIICCRKGLLLHIIEWCSWFVGQQKGCKWKDWLNIGLNMQAYIKALRVQWKDLWVQELIWWWDTCFLFFLICW